MGREALLVSSTEAGLKERRSPPEGVRSIVRL